MTNVFYMCFGIFIFVLGQIFQNVYTKRQSYEPDQCADQCLKEKETFIELPEELADMPNLNEIDLQGSPYEDAIQTFNDVKKTPATPPRTNEEGFYDYSPALHDETNVDVEVITTQREIEIFNRVNRLGGL